MPPAPALQSSAAAGSPSNDRTANTNNEYEEALDKLQPLQPVLRGFNHRNRNQHRRAAWWAPFGMLRRHIDKLVDELLDAATAAAVKSKDKKRKRSDNRAETNTRDHVKWLRDVLVPKCYLAFSQLTADNQFATLGVVLLSVLAQVNATCVRLIAAATAATAEGDGGTLAVRELHEDTTSASKEPRSSTNKNPPPEMPSQKGGAVISRDEVARAEKLRRKNAQLKEGGQAGSFDVPSSARKNMDHDDNATFKGNQYGTGSKSETKEMSDASSKVLKLAKKKKIKKGGDEFDDLFKGLF